MKRPTKKPARKAAIYRPKAPKPRHNTKKLLEEIEYLKNRCRGLTDSLTEATAQRERSVDEFNKMRADYLQKREAEKQSYNANDMEIKRVKEALSDMVEIVSRTVRIVLRENKDQREGRRSS